MLILHQTPTKASAGRGRLIQTAVEMQFEFHPLGCNSCAILRLEDEKFREGGTKRALLQ